MGAGMYSRMLGYKEWFEFNCAQRVHQNNVEHLSWTLPLFIVNGVFFPTFTAGLGGVVIAGRELYRMGYMSPEGPTSKIREIGAVPLNICELLAILSLSFAFMRWRCGTFFSNRGFVKYFQKSRFQIEYEKYADEFLEFSFDILRSIS